MKEVYRFPNGVTEQDGHLTWDIESLIFHVKSGVDKAKEVFGRIESLSVYTWGCDYVLMRDGQEVTPCFAYRDHRTEPIIKKVHEKIPFTRLYRYTGTQFQPFNTIYQLYADKEAGRLMGVNDFLMMPEYLMYRLTGVKAKEYTNATTTGMVNAKSRKFEPEIFKALGFAENMFPELHQPGSIIGEYDGIKVVLCATHDSASAVEGNALPSLQPFGDDLCTLVGRAGVHAHTLANVYRMYCGLSGRSKCASMDAMRDKLERHFYRRKDENLPPCCVVAARNIRSRQRFRRNLRTDRNRRKGSGDLYEDCAPAAFEHHN